MPTPETPKRLVIRAPDDWHLHLRDGAVLAAVLGHTARQFARAIVMPNLVPPVTTVAAAEAYRARILAALPQGLSFTPLMTAYLTDDIDADELARGHEAGVFTAAKLYPANATTNSAAGVTDVARIRGALGRMERIGMPLLVHGEVTDPEVDVFDREAVFIERILAPLLAEHPGLRVVLEHITTADAADFVAAGDDRLAATVTAHHLEINRNALFAGGLRPHAWCLPVAKRERHRQALRRAVASGSPKFFLGTDSAPHLRSAKERDCGCAGIFSAPVAMESYAKVFEELGALDRLEAFASEHGPRFYRLPPNEGTLVLERRDWAVPATVDGPGEPFVPFHAGATLGWRVVSRD